MNLPDIWVFINRTKISLGLPIKRAAEMSKQRTVHMILININGQRVLGDQIPTVKANVVQTSVSLVLPDYCTLLLTYLFVFYS